MITKTPTKLIDAIGEEAYEELVDLFPQQLMTEVEYAELKQDIREIRADINNLRSEVNERFDKMNERFDKMNERFDKMNERFDKINERFDLMYERTTSLIRWTIGTLALFGTIITILLAIGQFFGQK